jgi:hypothetical protein
VLGQSVSVTLCERDASTLILVARGFNLYW